MFGVKLSILNFNLAEQNKKTIAGRAEPSSQGRGAEPLAAQTNAVRFSQKRGIPLKKSSARV